ncbi:MAG: signal peptide peptidase SppA [Dokdonella sp.]|uniref:signal peptide peptidase SppA n=1 Tax=Dokdonella sp. TaxID=2291710 RepID=UPI0025B8C9E1|nr:signal peptide peptidase SppA [Dokdonella sp.]MBZ0222373.1 signal peptide peptidase SppA [Dokdonella sp.]MCC7255197.1 signal peptide peptidase SppA [Dokdonella sp.]
MTNTNPGPIRRFFRAIWNAVNFTRRLVFNLIFVIVLVAIIGAISSERVTIEARTALVLDPAGAVVEQYASDPTQRALAGLAGNQEAEVQLRDLLDAIDAAAKDKRIERMVFIPDQITSLGLASARELGAAFDRFKASGKEIIAVSAGMEQNVYLLATHANRILLDPEGAVLLEGFANYRSYYKDALDKLGVQAHLIRVGTFKSAGEPYVLDHASDAAKEADAYWMGGIWQEYLDEVGSQRKIDTAKLADDIAHYDSRIAAQNGDLAKLALEQKLVDELATRSQAREQLRALGAAEGSDSFRQIDYRHYLGSMLAQRLPRPGDAVAVVVAQGEIVPGERQPGMIGGVSTANIIRGAREDKSVKAIVLRVNSPGGDVFASEQVRRELAQAREAGKPVVVSMGDVAASGGYWISLASDEIWAEPNTITGSIGIFGLFMTIPDALGKLGINTDGVGTTPLAGAFDIRRPMSPQLEAVLASVIGRGYQQFIGNVAKARSKTPEQVDQIAQGRVWSGAQAKERGLVDKLGGLTDAIAAAAARAKLGDTYQVRYVEPPMSPWQRIAMAIGGSDAAVGIARWSGFSLPPGTLKRSELHELNALADILRGKRYAMFAHCLCEPH